MIEAVRLDTAPGMAYRERPVWINPDDVSTVMETVVQGFSRVYRVAMRNGETFNARFKLEDFAKLVGKSA